MSPPRLPLLVTVAGDKHEVLQALENLGLLLNLTIQGADVDLAGGVFTATARVPDIAGQLPRLVGIARLASLLNDATVLAPATNTPNP